MATYYFDSVLGNDTTGNGSQALPWAQYDSKYGSVADGDICLFKRGTTQSIATQFRAPRNGLSAAAPFVMAAYGEGANPKFIFTGTVWGYMLNFSRRSWVTVEDLDFDAQGLAQSTLYISGQDTFSVTGQRFRRCRFYNAGPLRDGVSVAKESTATTATVTDVEFLNCDFFDCGGHGVIATAATNIRFKKCRAWGNGATSTYGGHGISFRWNRSDATSGWTLVSGTVYKRTLTVGEAAGNVAYMYGGAYPRMIKNTGTPTTPAAGEFGVSAGELYVNFNTNANTISIRWAWGRCGNNLVEDCEFFNNIVNPSAEYIEGHGVAFDDFTEDSIIRRCRSYNNEGLGISVNRGDRNTIEDCLVYGNGINGLALSTSNASIVQRSTFANNNLGNSMAPTGRTSEISIASGGNSNTFRNLCLKAKTGGTQYGLDDSTGLTGTSVSYCNITGFTTAVRTATPTNVVAGDPLLASNYAPTPSSPLIGAGTHLGYRRDLDKKQRQNPPCIGAYDAATMISG